MTPFGIVHLVLTAAGVNLDGVDKQIRDAIENINAGTNGANEEKCDDL
jgi:hypothetical protein